MQYDVIIRGGTIVDGTGAPAFIGDLAILDGKIAAVGKLDADVTGKRVIDAGGLLVTPGFVDVHTHYDGQAIWSDRMVPSSAHGVTTAIMGNCGVGFAPCRPDDQDMLVNVMAGVEDIPGVVMVEGLPWTWESFPQYLDELESRPRDIDVAAYLPHSPLRVYVMGARGANREEATPQDRDRMRAIAREAAEAGAIGFATSRLAIHKMQDGKTIPTHDAAEAELLAILEGLKEGGGTLLQAVPDLPMDGDYAKSIQPLLNVASKAGMSLTYTLATGNDAPHFYRGALDLMDHAHTAGQKVTGQVFPRPIGLVVGLELTANPFVMCPTYREIAHLPLAERVAEMRKPDVRARILSEAPMEGHPLTNMARNWDWLFPFTGDQPDYEPAREDSISGRARARGVSPEEEAYDRLLDDDGHAMIMLALGNFQDGSLDTISELMQRDDVVVGLGDGGAHYGMICDASFPTTMLAYWARDRKAGRLSIEKAVQALTSKPAELTGLLDRGRIAPGYRADINLIDHDALRLHKPVMVADLPAGGRRLDQSADGYVLTMVSGEVIQEKGQPTQARPGKVVRGRQQAPAVANSLAN